MSAKKLQLDATGPVSNGGQEVIGLSEPYAAKISVEGTTPILFHRWNVDSVEEKAKAAKGSKAKKTDDVESYVWRNEAGHLCIPGEYFRQSLILAAKFLQDPRSPRKSAMDLFEAGLVVNTELASLGVKEWSRLDRRRVTVQGNGITRVRPLIERGWRATFDLEVILPEYITREILGAAITNAGRLIGVGDFRPTFGRFMVVEFR